MNDKKISPNRAKKERIVTKLSEKAAKAKGLVFTNYQGLTHKQLEKLKKAVKPFDADLVVTKNTLLKLSLLNSKLEARSSKQTQNLNAQNSKHLSVSDFDIRISDFQGATATLFLYGDPVGPLKEIAKVIKEFSLPFGLAQGGPAIKFGILDGQVLSEVEVLKLSALPSREALLTSLVFALKSPIFNLRSTLSWNLQKFVMTLKTIESKKS